MTQELDEDQLKALEKVEKLMRLAAKNTSPEEAASATAKYQELLVAYNLDMSQVGKHGAAADQRREQQVIRGGMYTWQREMWSQVARLNFCLYWCIEHQFDREIRRRHWSGEMQTRTVRGKEFRHTVVGKAINVRATLTMTSYLEQAIERLVKERYPLNSQRFMREAVAYREGIADTIYWKLDKRRRTLIEQEERRQADELARRGVSTSNALTIGSLVEQENDANNDFLHGEGWSARQRAARAERAERMRRAEEEYTRWAEAHPEEAAREAKAARKRARGRSGGGQGSRGGQTARDRRTGSSEYWQGRDRGESISLDQQMDKRSQERIDAKV